MGIYLTPKTKRKNPSENEQWTGCYCYNVQTWTLLSNFVAVWSLGKINLETSTGLNKHQCKKIASFLKEKYGHLEFIKNDDIEFWETCNGVVIK